MKEDENKIRMRNNRGITLVALIITIVVLLILAVTTIGAVRNSGIIDHAQNASSKYTIAQEKEKIGLALSEWNIQKVIPGNTKTFYDVMLSALSGTAEVDPNDDGTLTITFNKTGNVYTVDENGNITEQKENGKDEVTGSFGITVSQNDNSLLIVRATIPESWNDREFTDADEDLAAQVVGSWMRVKNSDNTPVSNLQQLIIAAVNDEYGDMLISTLGKIFSKDEYDTMISTMQSMPALSGVDISTPQRAFEYMVSVMKTDGTITKDYETVQKFAEDVDEYEYEATTKALKICKNGGEWINITEEASWSGYDASYIITENGEYEIQLELDGNIATKTIKVDNAETILWTEAKSNNQTYAGDATGSSTNPIIPAGFMPKNTKTAKWDAAGGPESNNGLVIIDSIGNEFVWVPATGFNPEGYPNKESIGTTGYREPDVVIGNGNECDAVVANLQIAECEEDPNDADTVLTAEDFKTQLTKEYEAMVASVNNYGGFYVGRYEISINSGMPQTKAGIGIKSVTAESANTWYGLYALNKKYQTSSVRSSMIWGIQYDAMMTWMGSKAETTIGENRNKYTTCGTAPDDVIKNVYDLYGNFYEWTLEAGRDSVRLVRGGSLYNVYSPKDHNLHVPTGTSIGIGSRIALYIV